VFGLDHVDVKIDRINMPTHSAAAEPLPPLSSAEVARRLGVKPATLYAYVSRGLLDRHRDATGSWFDPLQVEAFVQSRRAEPGAPGPGGTPLMVLDTDLADISGGELRLRGVPIEDLVATRTFDEVVAWLWDLPDPSFPLDARDEAVVRRAVRALPKTASLVDRAIVAVRAMSARDQGQPDSGAIVGASTALVAAGARMLAGLPAAFADRAAAEGSLAEGSTADRAWHALAADPEQPGGAGALDAALVLVADHDLAVSTLAARAAASARGSAASVMTAALGAFDSPLHGDASRQAAEVLDRVLRGATPREALWGTVRAPGHGIPGFGHSQYPDGDPRARALLYEIARIEGAGVVMGAVDRLNETVEGATGLAPNIDLALAALVRATGMRPDAGTALFAIGRTAGWIAHAAAEYRERPLRMRPRGRYTGAR
jgi:citrate synthase